MLMFSENTFMFFENVFMFLGKHRDKADNT